jgi:hypothetical protein
MDDHDDDDEVSLAAVGVIVAVDRLHFRFVQHLLHINWLGCTDVVHASDVS